MKASFLLLFVFAIAFTSFKMQTKKKIVFFGDSITQQGAGENGFIKKIDSMLAQKGVSTNYDLIGAGVSSDKIYDLYLRMDSDVLAKNPDAVIIFIGVNDVWHKTSHGTGTDPDKFERFYKAIIKKLKEKNITLYLCTPASIGEKNDFTNPLEGDLNKYAAIVRKLSKENNCTLIDLRQEFTNYLKTHNPDNKDRGILTTDGVHLSRAGNLFVARQMLTALNQGFIK